MSSAIGKRITYYRKKLGLTQTALASKLGISPSTLTRYENGSRELSALLIIDIAKELNVTPDALLGFEDPDFTAMKSAKSNTLRAIHDLNRLGQERVLEFVSALKELPRYSCASL